MSQNPNRMFDEIAKLMTDAAGVAQGAQREIESAFRSQAERFMAQMDVVKRDDFEAVKEMAANARTENDTLSARIDVLEARIAALENGKSTSAKPARQKKS